MDFLIAKDGKIFEGYNGNKEVGFCHCFYEQDLGDFLKFYFQNELKFKPGIGWSNTTMKLTSVD